MRYSVLCLGLGSSSDYVYIMQCSVTNSSKARIEFTSFLSLTVLENSRRRLGLGLLLVLCTLLA